MLFHRGDSRFSLFNPVPQAKASRQTRRLRISKLRISSGLEARHITCRRREPPEYEKYSDSGLKGRHRRQCVGPSGLRFIQPRIPVAYTTGIGYVGPPDLKRTTSMPAARGKKRSQPLQIKTPGVFS